MSGDSRAASPEPAAIRARREAAKLTRAEAAQLVHSTEWRWRDWESGKHQMAPGLWELFLLKLAQREAAE